MLNLSLYAWRWCFRSECFEGNDGIFLHCFEKKYKDCDLLEIFEKHFLRVDCYKTVPKF